MSVTVNIIDPSRDNEDDLYDIQLFYIRHTISSGRAGQTQYVTGTLSIERLKLAAWLHFKTVSIKSLRRVLIRGY